MRNIGMGWLPDLPDIRDYTNNHTEMKPLMKIAKLDNMLKLSTPDKIDLREWCSIVEDQESLGSCTAHAGVGLIEYMENKAFGKYIDASRLFLYKVTRNLLQLTGDTGAYLRSTIGAMRLFGVLPEEYWPYDIDQYEDEPPAFCYAYAQNYKSMKYMRLDYNGITPKDLLSSIKANLSAGLAAMFGFTVYNSIDQAEITGKIPMPSLKDGIAGGHAVMAVGFDDNIEILNSAPNSTPTKGAILIRNSWSEVWGEEGYGWLPYDYILQGLALDWWIILSQEWVDSGQFKA